MFTPLRMASAVVLGILLTACVAAPVADDNALRRVHTHALVLDAHADIEIPGQPSRYAGDDGLSRVAPEKMRAGGVDAVVLTIAAGPGPRNAEGYAAARDIARQKQDAALALASDPDDDVVLATTASELVEAHQRDQRAIILGFQNALILGKDLSGLDEFFAAGVRVFALTHLGHNDYADSSRPLYNASAAAHEPVAEHGGLSALGRRAVERINKLGAIVDVSQLSKEATLQAIALSASPVIASHSNVRALTDVSRNLSDEEIDRIGETGGVINVSPFRGYLFDSSDPSLQRQIREAREQAGIPQDYFYPFELYWEIKDPAVQSRFLTQVSQLLGPVSVDDMLDHLDYIVQRIGVDHVGIGTDFNHGSSLAGFSDASDARNVTKALLQRGYSSEEISKIWGGNFLRVFRLVQP